MTASKVPPTLVWVGNLPGRVDLLDQTLLPEEEKILSVTTAEEMWDCIRRLAVRGAPAIGVAAAYGYVLGLQKSAAQDRDSLLSEASRVRKYLATSRPTAVNLFWALDRMHARLEALPSAPTGELLASLLQEARAIHQEDEELCRQLGRHGSTLVPREAKILTHCNAGSLATGGQGTALSVIFEAAAEGKVKQVYADETRPLLQGARLTCWELGKREIPATLLCDSAAATALSRGMVDLVFVGADRIAANGDVVNKIGTYPLAVLCQRHAIPFYVVAPYSTFDFSLSSGSEIPIEERPDEEVTAPLGRQAAPKGTQVFNPAFDLTPADLVSGIVTERGIVLSPTREKIQKLFGTNADSTPAHH